MRNFLSVQKLHLIPQCFFVFYLNLLYQVKELNKIELVEDILKSAMENQHYIFYGNL